MIYSVTTGGYAENLASFWSALLAPVQRLSASISERVTASIDMLVNANRYYEENKQLKKQLGEIYNDMIDYDRLKTENEDLRKMLELKEEHGELTFSPPCSVIARTTNDPFASFTIDKGSKDGIRPNDPVIASGGIVGMCYDVGISTARVRTLYSPKTAIGVYSLRTRTAGIIEGDYELAEKGLCRMNYIDKSSDITAGDIIVTSGSANYPAGQLVGTVTETGIEDSGLSMYAVIMPMVDPTTVSDVFAVTGFEYEALPEDSTAAEDAFAPSKALPADIYDDAARAAAADGDELSEQP
jgi:rod shape-determining protein MreC